VGQEMVFLEGVFGGGIQEDCSHFFSPSLVPQLQFK